MAGRPRKLCILTIEHLEHCNHVDGMQMLMILAAEDPVLLNESCIEDSDRILISSGACSGASVYQSFGIAAVFVNFSSTHIVCYSEM